MKKTYLKAVALLCIFSAFLIIGCTPTENKMYTVSFYNGTELIISAEYEWGAQINFPSAPSKESDETYDYIFKGWSSDQGSDSVVADKVSVYDDLDFYAVFERRLKKQERTYTVTFLDGYTGDIIETQKVKEGGDAVAPNPPDHTKEGRAFLGWQGSYQDVRRSVTIVATYGVMNMKLTRHYIGRTREDTYSAGAFLDLSKPLIDSVFVFEGWYYDENYTRKANEGDTMPVEDIDLYAKIDVDFSSFRLEGDDLVYGGENEIRAVGLVGEELIDYELVFGGDGVKSGEDSVKLEKAGNHNVSVTANATYSYDGKVVLTTSKTISEEFIVDKAPLSAQLSVNSSYVYGQKPQFDISVSGFIGDDEAKENIIRNLYKEQDGEYVLTNQDKLDVGKYRYVVSVGDESNYALSEVAEFTVTPKEIEVSVKADDFTYGDDILDKNVLPSLSYNPEDFEYDDEIGDVLEESFTYTTKSEPYTYEGHFDAGRYTAKFNGTLSPNYTAIIVSKSFSVDKKKINITASAQSAEYGKTYDLHLVLDDEILEDDKAAIDVKEVVYKGDEKVSAEKLGVGSYTASAEYNKDAAKNYSILVKTTEFEITKATLTVNISANDITYGDTPSPAVEISGFVYDENKEVVSNGQFTYLKDGQPFEGKFVVGSYTVQASEYSAQNYNIVYGKNEASFKISKKPLNVKVGTDKAEYVYGETPKYSLQFGDGLAFNDNETVAKNLKYVTSLKDGEMGDKYTVGNYTVIAQADFENYEPTFEQTNFTVAPKQLTVTLIGDDEFTFGDKISFTVSYEGFAFGEGENVIKGDAQVGIYNGNDLVTLPHPDAGEYFARLSGVSADNYTIPNGEKTFTINKREVKISQTASVKWSAGWSFEPTIDADFEFKNIIRLNTDVTDTYIAIDEQSFKAENFEWGKFSGSEWSKDESYIIYDKADERDVSANFTVVYDLNVTLNNSVFNIIVPSGIEFDYDGNAHEFAITVTVDEGDDTVAIIEYAINSDAYSATKPSIVNKGVYTVKYRVSDKDAHYASVENSFTVNVRQAKNTITTDLTDITKVYNGQAVNIDSRNTSALFGAVTVTYLLGEDTVQEIKDAGEYTIRLTSDSDEEETQNYISETKEIKVTIQKADFVVSNEQATSTYDKQAAEGGIQVTCIDEYTVTYSYNDASASTVKELNIVDAGTYSINYTLTSKNYNDKTGTYTLIIDPVTLTVDNGISGNYGEEITFPEVKGILQGDDDLITRTIVYRSFLSDAVDATLEDDKPKDAGTYTVTYTAEKNYKFENNSNSFTTEVTVNRLEGKAERNDTVLPEYTYTGTEQEVDVTKYYDVTGDGTLTATNNKFTDVPEGGTLKIEVTLNETVNYTGAQYTFDVTVKKAEYENVGDPQTDSDIVMGFDENGAPKKVGSLGLNADWHWTDSEQAITLGENTAKVYYRDESKAQNYNDKQGTITFNVRREKLTPIAEVRSAKFGTSMEEIKKLFVASFKGEGGRELNEFEKAYIETSVNTENIDETYGGTYKVEYTFKLISKDNIDGNDYFELVTSTVTGYFKLTSVEYNGVFYTLEDALNVASDEGTIYVRNNTRMAETDIKDAIYNNDSYYTVKEHVTLILPYNGDKWDESTGGSATQTTVAFGDANKRKLELVLPESIKLINKGIVNIGGQTTGGNGGGYGGQTYGDYAQITLDNGAKIESYGNIVSYGFIVEKTQNNNSEVRIKGGTLTVPFFLIEHRGGTIFFGAYSKMDEMESAPFNRYLFHNVTASLCIESAGQLMGHANLYAGSQENKADVKLIGSKDSGSLIALNDNSYVIAKYQATEFNTQNKIVPTKLDIYGDMTLNSMDLTITVFIPITLSTKAVLFPISWLYDVSLNTLPGSESATVDATAQKIKILPGGSLTVNKGVTLKAQTIAVYADNDWNDVVVGTGASGAYEENKGDGKLKVNGTLTVDTLVGVLQDAEENGAKVQINTAVNKTVHEMNGTSKWSDIELKLKLKVDGAEKEGEVGTYTWNGTSWEKQQ